MSGADVAVLAPGYGAGDRLADAELERRVIRIPGLGGKWVKALPLFDIILGWLYLCVTILRGKPDIVLFITEEAEAAGGLLPYFPFKPVVRVAGSGITTCFYGNRFFKKIMRFPMKRLYDRSRLIIAVSKNTGELLESVGVPGGRIKVIYNGVEEEMLTRKPHREKLSGMRKRYGIHDDTKVLLTVARVLPRKGQDTVIRALPTVLEEFPNTVYIIVGEGRYREQFRELAIDTGVGGRVIFTGGVRHEEIMDYIDLCDIFVMPNRYWNNKIEGLPNALIEASARGKPVIAGSHGGSVEAVRSGVTGLLADPESASNVAEAVLALLRDPEKARLMGENGRQSVEEFHTVTGMINNYLSAIKTVYNNDGNA